MMKDTSDYRQSGHTGEFHPDVPTEPDVNLAIHPALPVQSRM
jgi:hypothetical protein